MEGELYIARRSRPVATPAALPAELQQAIESPLAGIRAGAVQELAGVLRGRHAGMALAARLALEQLTDDDSRSVAAAATAALGTPAPAPAPARPELALSASIIDLGRLPLHSQSPERRVQVGNAGGGDLNARATASASWLKLRQVGDEFVVAADTSAAGEYEGTITVDSDGGTAAIRVRARVDPALPVFEAAAPIHPDPVPEAPAAARPASQQDLDLAMVASAAADAIPPVTQMSLAPANLAAGQAVAGPDISPAAPADGGSQGTTPPPRDDHPPVAAGRPGPGAGEKTARAPRPRRGGRTIRRRPVIIATAIGTAAIGLVIAIIISVTPSTPGTPGTPGTSGTSGTPVAPGGSLRWVYTTPNQVDSRPVVVGGVVYVGGFDGKMYALDAATGHARWAYTTGNSVASGAAVTGGTVYFGSDDHKVYALDAATGHVRWSYTTGSGVESRPAVAEGTVYVGSQDGKVYALDAATGHVRWSYTTGNQGNSGPAVVGGTVYVGSDDGKVYALDAATGHVRWSYTTANIVSSSPAVVGGTVYVGSIDGKVYALDAATGHLRWSYTTGLGVQSDPAVVGGTVYIGSLDHKVYALDAATGQLRWSYTTEAKSSPARRWSAAPSTSAATTARCTRSASDRKRRGSRREASADPILEWLDQPPVRILTDKTSEASITLWGARSLLGRRHPRHRPALAPPPGHPEVDLSAPDGTAAGRR